MSFGVIATSARKAEVLIGAAGRSADTGCTAATWIFAGRPFGSGIAAAICAGAAGSDFGVLAAV